MPLTNLRQKDMDICLETQINNVNSTYSGDVPTSQMSTHLPNDSNHLSNKWRTASVDECRGMLNNHDFWGLMGVNS